MSGNAVAECAKKYKGVKYVWGGESPSGFDCSGLVKYCYKQAAGKDLPHFTGDLMNKGKKVSRKNLKVGDLVFPSSHHVGIYVGNDQIIHAPKKGDVVKISKIWSFYTARRIL
jgi:cell wall-associated NlpC family hydrolase